MKTRSTFLAFGLALSLLGITAVADPGLHPAGFALHKGAVADQLGLTDEQRASIEAILEAAREIGEPLREDAVEVREELAEAGDPENYDAAAVASLAAEAGELKAQSIILRLDTRAQIAAVLTAEQVAMIQEIRQQRRERRQQRRQNRRGS